MTEERCRGLFRNPLQLLLRVTGLADTECFQNVGMLHHSTQTLTGVTQFRENLCLNCLAHYK
jgi:hypothetical protein